MGEVIYLNSRHNNEPTPTHVPEATIKEHIASINREIKSIMKIQARAKVFRQKHVRRFDGLGEAYYDFVLRFAEGEEDGWSGEENNPWLLARKFSHLAKNFLQLRRRLAALYLNDSNRRRD